MLNLREVFDNLFKYVLVVIEFVVVGLILHARSPSRASIYVLRRSAAESVDYRVACILNIAFSELIFFLCSASGSDREKGFTSYVGETVIGHGFVALAFWAYFLLLFGSIVLSGFVRSKWRRSTTKKILLINYSFLLLLISFIYGLFTNLFDFATLDNILTGDVRRVDRIEGIGLVAALFIFSIVYLITAASAPRGWRWLSKRLNTELFIRSGVATALIMTVLLSYGLYLKGSITSNRVEAATGLFDDLNPDYIQCYVSWSPVDKTYNISIWVEPYDKQARNFTAYKYDLIVPTLYKGSHAIQDDIVGGFTLSATDVASSGGGLIKPNEAKLITKVLTVEQVKQTLDYPASECRAQNPYIPFRRVDTPKNN